MGWGLGLGGAVNGKSPHLACEDVDAPKQNQDVAKQQQGVSSSHFPGEEGLQRRQSGRTWGLESPANRETLS